MNAPKTRGDAEADIIARLRRLDELGPFVETVDVAGLLKWSTETIRNHIVPIGVWASKSPRQRKGIPALRLGHKYKIPAIWVRDMLDLALLEVRSGEQEPDGPSGR